MAGIITFTPKTTLATIRSEFRYTAARLAKHTLTAGSLAATFLEFQAKLAAAEEEEEALLMSLEECNASVAFLDDELDAVVDQAVGVTGNRRGPGLYRELFGNKRIFEFKRPMLNEQLDNMMSWPEVLAERTEPVLMRVAERLAQLIPAAQAAQAEKNSVQTRLVVFRETGTRAQVTGEFNALRKSTFGALSQLQHEHKLGTGWAESFFQQYRSSQPTTVLEVERRLEANASEATYLRDLHQELLAKQAAAAETARLAEERARQAEIAGKRDLLARIEAELAELEGSGSDGGADE